MKKNSSSKKVFVSTVSAALVVSALAPIILVSEVSAADGGFDTSKVNLANFNVKDVTGGVSVSLTSTAKKITNEIHIPAQINGKNVVSVASHGFRESKASAIYFEDSSLITSIGDFAFADALATNTISLMNIEEVPYASFAFSSFNEIQLDAYKVTSIGIDAFEAAKATNEISLLNITTVPEYAFWSSAFRGIHLDGTKITSIKSSAFSNAKATNSISLPNLTTLPNHAFYKSSFSEIHVDGEKITSIGDFAFAHVQAVNKISLPNITNVPKGAFYNSSLSEIILDGTKITSIGERAFKEVKATHEISFPNITDIPFQAFYDSAFNLITLDSEKITSVHQNAFSATPYINFNIQEDSTMATILVKPRSQVNVAEMKFAKGIQTADYFSDNGTTVTDNQFDVFANGTYTVFLKDGANRTVVNTITVSNIDMKVKNIQAEWVDKQVNITWDALEGATRYRVQPYVLNEETGEFEVYRLALATTDTQVSFTNLEDNKTYKFEVIPLIVTYIYEYASFSNETTIPKDYIVPTDLSNSPVENVVVAENDDETVSITWDALEGATRYRVQAYVLNEATGVFDKHYLALATYDTFLTYSNVKEGKTYRFEVIPMFGTYITERAGLSNDITMSVEEIPENEKPTLEVTVDGTTASFSWAAMENIERYRVQLYIKNELGQFVKQGASRAITTTTHQVTNLKLGNTYQMVVEPRIGYVYDTQKALSVTFNID